jgi:intracellular sulfur oxidation DsrE/DsrF family protein
MNTYLFIESRDPFESRDTRFVTETAIDLKRKGNQVAVYFVQNGVLAARRSALCPHILELAKAGVSLLADDFSLRERGIDVADLAVGIREAGVDRIVDDLVSGARAVWH